MEGLIDLPARGETALKYEIWQSKISLLKYTNNRFGGNVMREWGSVKANVWLVHFNQALISQKRLFIHVDDSGELKIIQVISSTPGTQSQ